MFPQRLKSTRTSPCMLISGAGASTAWRTVSRGHEKGYQDNQPLGETASLDSCFWTHEECEEEMDAILVGYDGDSFGFL